MDAIHGVDISWMSKHSPKDHQPKVNNGQPKPSIVQQDSKPEAKPTTGGGKEQPLTPPKSIAIPTRPSFSRSASSDRTLTVNGGSPKPASPGTLRRNSWLSSISSKFSSSGTHANHVPPPPASHPAPTAPSTTDESIPTGPQSPKNAVLPHAVKAVGDEPYTPAPPKATQANFLQSALRRLSSSGGGLANGKQGTSHGLCERRVLNIDHDRERCKISELDQGKLRRVSFCVDVEVASGPRYTEDVEDDVKIERKEKKKLTEKGEGDALKRPLEVQEEKENDGFNHVTGEVLAKAPGKEPPETITDVKDDAAATGEKDCTKKKEKKKRSEEERKARKEKKRKIAEENGMVPVELVRAESESSLGSVATGTATPKTQSSPTTDPVRIYRRCCQLRETPILKRITEQLAASALSTSQSGVVEKLDLTGYWLQLPDLITLGDYLAVVPVKDLIMENCGLTDEGVRVILAGLLAAKSPTQGRRNTKGKPDGWRPPSGFVERVVFQGNTKIGADGWRYICLFINMCRTLKSMDLSKVPFPQPVEIPPIQSTNAIQRTPTASSASVEIASILSKAIAERLGGAEFELLNMAECGLTTDQIGSLVDGVIKSGLRRLGLAGNNITPEGMEHIARYIRNGKCEGLDLGGNDLSEQLGVIAGALDENNGLYALSLADCNLTPDSLWTLFPPLCKLKNFRFIDLSQNHKLFEEQPSALSLLRRYLPKMPILKRIHLTDVSMTPEQAIALAEILPDMPSLAHVNILENPQLAVLANAKDEANQEEACALYASLMAAVRVSKTIVCIDIEVPSNDSSEIVKALAKQVIAYCLWNMERGPVAEISQPAAAISDGQIVEKNVPVADVILHLVGHVEGFPENHDDDEPAPDDDYVIGGTGVVKALGICLRNRVNDTRRRSVDHSRSATPEGRSGTVTPTANVSGGKAKDMSKNLLGSARKIRARLQPALVKESNDGDRNNYQRLLFLDQTLEGMIKRFEDEFPETRIATSVTPIPPVPPLPTTMSNAESTCTDLSSSLPDETDPALVDGHASDDEFGLPPVLSRHNSDVSLASRALAQEEGRMHRFGQKFRRGIILPPGTVSDDAANANSALEAEALPPSKTDGDTTPDPHPSLAPAVDKDKEQQQQASFQLFRAYLEGMGGEELKRNVLLEGEDAVLRNLHGHEEVLRLRRQLIDEDPESWLRFVESQKAADRNRSMDAGRGRANSDVQMSSAEGGQRGVR